MDFDYRLLAKYLIDTLSPEEMGKVQEWRVLSIDNEYVFSKLVELRISGKFTQYNTSEHIEKALEGLNAKINSRRRFQIFHSVMRYAAVILLLVSFSYVGWDYLRPDNYVTITVKQGEDVKKIMLADGSAVWLKGGASLKIPEAFAENSRKLSLQRMHNLHYMFRRIMSIKVLGTAFNVKTDEKHQNVETVLARGKVALFDKQWKAVLDMSPGEKVTYNNYKNEYATEFVDVNICTAWRLNQFVFENVTLREIVNQLSVKFNVNINLESSKLAQRKFRCVINEDESLSDILKLLKFLAPIQYRIEGSEIFIYE